MLDRGELAGTKPEGFALYVRNKRPLG
ncbi:hypothetical protein NITLEN_60055 [Nitrospira lenta]|uniref:Uncharacterized protein n=1 Tax=Nitrospira lenta TaxID=1436998 RepID=A0A330LAB6_9BACT|nr:hypothetical protein NITLEN_60055 [Nitrospira lenta]